MNRHDILNLPPTSSKMLHKLRTCEQKCKKHVTIAQKLDLIEQNQCDFWIQRIRFVLMYHSQIRISEMYIEYS